MDYTIFAQSIAQIRVFETRMLNRGKIDALVEAKDFPEALRMLQDSQYSKYVALPSYEEGLKLALEELYRDMYKIIPVKEVVDVLAIRYDGHNIKALLKGKLSGTDVSRLLINVGTIPINELKTMISEENYKLMPEILTEHIKSAVHNYNETNDPRNLDILIDKGIYEYMLEVAVKSKMEFLTDITKVLIDVTNIKTFIRVKTQEKGIEFLDKVLLDGGSLKRDLFHTYLNDSLDKFADKILYTDYSKWAKNGIGEFIETGDLGSVERFGDNFIINYLKKAKLVSFGTEPIVAYILARENEIKILRIILTGKKNAVHPDLINERMRDVYV